MVHVTRVLRDLKLRKLFKVPDKTLLQWFPGHMGKGLKQIQQKIKSVDCVIEVHDARIPQSGRNPDFRRTVTGLKPHILVLNKMDLADLDSRETVVENLRRDGFSEVVFTNCKDHRCSGVKSIVPLARELISKSDRFNRSELADYCLMVIGVPNVGKSSLINALRNRFLNKSNVAPVGAVAGITKSVTSKIKISEKPLMYVLDTPGILTPSVRDVESGLKLALCSSMQDHLVGTEHIADYLLYWLNKNHNFSYVKYLGLGGPSDNITEVLMLSALNMKKILRRKTAEGYMALRPDTEFAAQHFIKAFRTGEFGKVLLDEVEPPTDIQCWSFKGK